MFLVQDLFAGNLRGRHRNHPKLAGASGDEGITLIRLPLWFPLRGSKPEFIAAFPTYRASFGA